MSEKEWEDILALSQQHSFPYRKLIETGNNICQGTLCVNGSCSYILSSLNVLPLDALPSLPFHNNMQDKSPNAQTSHTLIISSCLMTFFGFIFLPGIKSNRLSERRDVCFLDCFFCFFVGDLWPLRRCFDSYTVINMLLLWHLMKGDFTSKS